MAMNERKSERLDIRVTPQERALLQAASQSARTNLSDFVLMHARKAAEDVLADRRVFVLSAEKWDAFAAALDEPPRDMPKLKKMLGKPSVLGG